MADLTAKRTLVKSPPELWDELSEVERLAKHLGRFGEIRITKLDPEQTVAWEGEHASGTVSIEPSGWGTKVTLTAELTEAEIEEPAGPEPAEAEPEPEPAEAEPIGLLEAAIDEPAGPEPAVPEPGETEPPVEHVVEEPDIVTPHEPESVQADEPAQRQPARRRGRFWAWLFRPRRTEQFADEEAREASAEEPEPPEPASIVLAEPQPEKASSPAPAAEPEPAGSVSKAPSAEAEAGGPVSEAPAAEPEREPEKPVLRAPSAGADAGGPVLEAPPLESEAEAPCPEGPPPEAPGSDSEASGAASGRLDRDAAEAVLRETLDALGSAHHRPFSRG
jgi:hypothetical protein